MTQLWENDKVIAVTPVLAGPCVVSQVKTEATDGYNGVQLAWGERKAKNIKKPQAGHLKKISSQARFLKEFRAEAAPTCALGDLVKVDSFAAGEIIDVIGTSKGKGFQGVVKRHGFHGGRKTHGNKDQLRMPGSIGPKGPAHVFKGTRMAGNMGNERVTVKNLKVIKIDEENNIIYIQGAVPGAVNGFLMIKAPGELKFLKAPAPVAETPAAEATVTPAEEAKTVETPLEQTPIVEAEVGEAPVVGKTEDESKTESASVNKD